MTYSYDTFEIVNIVLVYTVRFFFA